MGPDLIRFQQEWTITGPALGHHVVGSLLRKRKMRRNPESLTLELLTILQPTETTPRLTGHLPIHPMGVPLPVAPTLAF
jgi:L-arabinose isomerase